MARTHRGDVGDVRDGDLGADVVATGPLVAPVPAADHPVGRHDDRPRTAHRDGGVVPRAHRTASRRPRRLPRRAGTAARAGRDSSRSRSRSTAPPPCGDVRTTGTVASGARPPDTVGAPGESPTTRRPDDKVESSGPAYILIQTDVGRAAAVAATIADIEGVVLAEDVTGPYDVIARVEASTVDELGKLVISRIQDTDGITRTLTCTVVHV